MRLQRYALFLVVLTVLVIPTNTYAYTQESSGISIWYVGGAGAGNLTSITDAVLQASNKDVIQVYPGTYYENIVVNVSIKLTSVQGYHDTIIDGNQTGIPLIINADDCEISGFTIKNPGDSFEHISCASLRADSCNFSNNMVVMKKVYHADTKSAVEAAEGTNNVISDNIIVLDHHNPLIESGVLVRDNAYNTEIKRNNISKFAIGVKVERKCNDTRVFKNHIYNNSNAIISYGNKCNISQNILYNNTWWFIALLKK